MNGRSCAAILTLFVFWSCKKNSGADSTPPTSFYSTGTKINGQTVYARNYDINLLPILKFSFSSPIDKSTVPAAVSFKDKGGNLVNYGVSYENNDKAIIIQPNSDLNYLSK